MKKYRHKKTKVEVIEKDTFYQVPIEGKLPKWIVENSPAWEEVVEKDYEILTYKNFITGNVYFIGQEFLSNEGYREFTKSDLDKINSTTNKKVYSIHSVKRLSDGKVFTVGKTYYDNHYRINTVINKIYILDGQIKFVTPQVDAPMREFDDIKKPLFTTEDGVDIFEGDEVWGITKGVWKPFYRIAKNTPDNVAVNEKWLHGKFSTKEAAEEYVLMNKPDLSINDVLRVFPTMMDIQLDKLKYLIKKKQDGNK